MWVDGRTIRRRDGGRHMTAEADYHIRVNFQGGSIMQDIIDIVYKKLTRIVR